MNATTQYGGLTEQQVNALSITERVNSGISLVGILFILITYLFCPSFNKPINRLIFFAIWANLGTCIAALISIDGFRDGSDAPLCKFQAFLVQMFLGVDAYWALCMAINVYLAFFRGFTVEQLRSLDVRYLIACYGASFVPALVFIFINSPNAVYGDAIIWCWISPEWDFLRLVVLYAIVWVALLLSLIVYIMAARVIYKKRSQLQGFLNPWNESPFANVITTEITVTTEDKGLVHGTEEGQPAGFDVENDLNDAAYSVNVEAGRRPSNQVPAALNIRSVTRDVAVNETNAESWLYARVAFLFFFALAITWIPASINRIYGVVHPFPASFALNYLSSFVFPLQGFWNVVVYIWTSRTACKSLWASIRGRGSTLNQSSRRGIRITSPRQTTFAKRGRMHTKGYEEADGEGMMMGKIRSGSGRTRFGSQGSSIGALTGGHHER